MHEWQHSFCFPLSSSLPIVFVVGTLIHGLLGNGSRKIGIYIFGPRDSHVADKPGISKLSAIPQSQSLMHPMMLDLYPQHMRERENILNTTYSEDILSIIRLPCLAAASFNQPWKNLRIAFSPLACQTGGLVDRWRYARSSRLPR